MGTTGVRDLQGPMKCKGRKKGPVTKRDQEIKQAEVRGARLGKFACRWELTPSDAGGLQGTVVWRYDKGAETAQGISCTVQCFESLDDMAAAKLITWDRVTAPDRFAKLEPEWVRALLVLHDNDQRLPFTGDELTNATFLMAPHRYVKVDDEDENEGPQGEWLHLWLKRDDKHYIVTVIPVDAMPST